MGSQINDISLEDYIAVKPKFAVYVPHTAGRYQKKRFRKAQCPIVERWAASSASSATCNPTQLMACCSDVVLVAVCMAGGLEKARQWRQQAGA